MKRGRLSQYDPAKNKLQSDVSKAINAALDANIEKKLCTYAGASTVTYNGTVISLTANMVRGDASINECTGIQILPRSLKIRITWSTTVDYNTYRMVVFRWHDSSLPVGSGLMVFTGGNLAPLSPLSWLNRHKISVLYDHQDLMYLHGSATAAQTHVITVNPGKYPIQLPLSGAGAVPQMDGLYLLLISDDGLVPTPAADVYSELIYTDA